MDLAKRPKYAALAALGIYSLLLSLFAVQTPSTLARLASFIPLIIVALFTIYDKFAWRWKILHWFSKRPDLNGTWFGTLESHRRDDEDRRIQSRHDVALVIHQDFTSVDLSLISAESKSRSSAAHIGSNTPSDFYVQYQYDNLPRLKHRRRSPAHTGGSTIEVSGLRPTELEGEYWTARESQGTYSLKRVSRKTVGTFKEAKELASAEDQ